MQSLAIAGGARRGEWVDTILLLVRAERWWQRRHLLHMLQVRHGDAPAVVAAAEHPQ